MLCLYVCGRQNNNKIMSLGLQIQWLHLTNTLQPKIKIISRSVSFLSFFFWREKKKSGNKSRLSVTETPLATARRRRQWCYSRRMHRWVLSVNLINANHRINPQACQARPVGLFDRKFRRAFLNTDEFFFCFSFASFSRELDLISVRFETLGLLVGKRQILFSFD